LALATGCCGLTAAAKLLVQPPLPRQLTHLVLLLQLKAGEACWCHSLMVLLLLLAVLLLQCWKRVTYQHLPCQLISVGCQRQYQSA
jgi:hypothetical protein